MYLTEYVLRLAIAHPIFSYRFSLHSKNREAYITDNECNIVKIRIEFKNNQKDRISTWGIRVDSYTNNKAAGVISFIYRYTQIRPRRPRLVACHS